eukprot:CAMPEP_0182896540 /NCGR_PEP_ID=MMETSP0034_2-20130328/26336_1 /TAXON_ID=156128 /ORGANISM="Nephroselmis pyriformis, Strain CCMP717" /LENGTH=55 /DNA_ID=CAMNT_0025030411 /DNA_START=380 /DNA_END=547 /DNA_ORIENTATION=+
MALMAAPAPPVQTVATLYASEHVVNSAPSAEGKRFAALGTMALSGAYATIPAKIV